MARIVVNPHRDTESDIRQQNSRGSILTHRGEILICNEIGNEGIYVLNSNNKLVKVGVNLSTATSAITKEYIDQLVLDIYGTIGSAVTGVFDNVYTKEETDNRIVEFMSGYSGTSIDENIVREIASGVVTTSIDALVDNADERYNTLGKISNAVSEINESLVNVEDTVSGITESVSGFNDRISFLEGVVSGVTKSTDHFVITYDEYQELITNGRANTTKYGVLLYSDDHYYCIVEDGEIGPTPETGSTILSGDTIVFDENNPYDDGSDDGSEPSIYLGEIDEPENGVLEVDWLIDDEQSDEPSGEPSEDIEVSGNTITVDINAYDDGISGGTEPSIYIGEIDEPDNGVIEVPWDVDGDQQDSGSNIDEIINGNTTTLEPEGAEIENSSSNTLTLPNNFSIDDNEDGIITIE